MIRIFCAYGLEFKDSDVFNHYLCTLIPAIELAYKTSINSSTGKTPAMLEKGWNPRLPYENLKNNLVDINQKQEASKLFLTRQELMKTEVCKIISSMQNKDGIKVISHLTLK
ncbi:hypothetical protein O181_116190 [Austropuccinia psidii MF-1]|uniref:Uncharacterized protein n=1 Tax=Austropuccinia psidii MF-1 TaxID=1389203 RepID=A0A9Q3KBW8_9BASI|nr:hypothetical protein [Austropuccinia psidii MF-1]